MRQRILAFDLDGTLLDNEGRLGRESKRALGLAREAGCIVAFVTGRRDIDMLPIGNDTRYSDYMVLNNGGKIVETGTSRVLQNIRIAAKDSRRLLSFCLDGDYLLHVVNGRFWAVNKMTPGILSYSTRLGISPLLYHSAEELPDLEVEGFMANDGMEIVARFIDRNLPSVCHTNSEPGCIDIMRSGVDKWDGLSSLSRLVGFDDPEIIAAGNYRNDIRMIQNATIGIAVSNALDEVKASADYVTARSNEEDPAVEIIERFITRRVLEAK